MTNHPWRRLGAWLCLAAATTACGAEVPLADFAKLPQFRDIKISPGGDHLAASAVVRGKAVLSLIRLADMKGVNLRPRDTDEIADFWWATPGRVLYTVSRKTGGLEQPVSTGELFAVDADGGSQKLLAGYGVKGEPVFAEPVHPLSVSDGRVLVSLKRWNGSRDGAFPSASWLDLYSGRVTPIVAAPMRDATFVADNQGEVRFAYARGADQKARIYFRGKAGAGWDLVYDEAKSGPGGFPLHFDRSGAKVYFDCGGARGVGGLCLWDVAQRTLAPLWSGTEAGVDEVEPTFDGQDLFALRTMPGRPETVLLDSGSREAKLLGALAAQFPGEEVRITSHSRDGRKVVFLVQADVDPGRFYLYDEATRKAELLFARMPWIPPEAMAHSEPIALKSRDGLPLHGYLTRPHGADEAKNLPLVVYVHGGPYGIRDGWEFDSTVQALASRGYAVLQVNYRGSGGYGSAFEHAGYREWGARMQDDLTDATLWAVDRGIADPRRLCIFGGSYGGYAALEGAVREPDLYRCAIGYVGVYDLKLMYSSGDIPQSEYGRKYLESVLGTDDSVLWDRSPLAHVDRLKAKVMLIVGGADWRVSPIQGERLHGALDRAGIPHEWLYKRTEGHGFYDEGNRAELLERVLAFLGKSIGPAPR